MASHHHTSTDTVSDGPGHPHAVPLWLLSVVFAALVFLTFVTVWITRVDGNQVGIGSLNILLALLIAVIKAALVLLYFMHLRWDSGFNALIIIASLLFVFLFIGFLIVDTSAYRPFMTPPGGFAPATQVPVQ